MTFEQLEDLFFTLQIQANPSGFHGFLCGRLSCGAVDMRQVVDASSQWRAMAEEQAEAAENAIALSHSLGITAVIDAAATEAYARACDA